MGFCRFNCIKNHAGSYVPNRLYSCINQKWFRSEEVSAGQLYQHKNRFWFEEVSLMYISTYSIWLWSTVSAQEPALVWGSISDVHQYSIWLWSAVSAHAGTVSGRKKCTAVQYLAMLSCFIARTSSGLRKYHWCTSVHTVSGYGQLYPHKNRLWFEEVSMMYISTVSD